MQKTLFSRNGDAVAYLMDDFRQTIYLLSGFPVAYLYEDRHIYGLNGRHLGWFIAEVLYDHDGKRIGFTSRSCPFPVAKESPKGKRRPTDEPRARWTAPPLPELGHQYADMGLTEFLMEGQIALFQKEGSPQEAESQ